MMVFSVPDRMGGLLNRLGFKPTQKNRSHWWRVFDPRQDKAEAERITQALREAGLTGKWSQVAIRRPRRDINVLKAETAKELRLAEEAYKRACEMRRQAERRVNRELSDRAQTAVRKARGEDRPGDHSRRREPPAP